MFEVKLRQWKARDIADSYNDFGDAAHWRRADGSAGALHHSVAQDVRLDFAIVLTKIRLQTNWHLFAKRSDKQSQILHYLSITNFGRLEASS